MDKIKTICWALKLTFLLHPLRSMVNLFVITISSVIPVYLAIYVGNTINSVAGLLGRPSTEVSDFIVSLIMLGFLLVLNPFLFYGSGIIMSALNVKISTQINEKLASAVKSVPIQYFDNTKFCDRFSIAQEGFNNIVPTADNVFWFIGEIISFFAAAIVIAKTSGYLLLLVLLSFFIGYKLNMWSKKTQHNYWMDTTKQRRLSSYLSGLFFSRSAAKEIRSFGMDDFLFEKWFSIKKQLREESYAMEKKSGNFFAYYQLFMDVFNIIILVISILLVKSGQMEVGGIVTIWQLSKNILMSVQTINSSYADLYYNNEKVLEAKNFLAEFAGSQKLLTREKAVPENNKKNSTDGFHKLAYELKNVSFSYTEGNTILKNINLTVSEGETIAICGANGSGKSTLIKLMLGLYSPEKGEVFVFGKKTDRLTAKDIGIAFQDYVCYPFSYRENVGFGCLAEMENDNAIETASKQGGAIELLKKYGAEKLLTKTMDKEGTELSGGEWQRIALSRANMGQKPLMIFDEPAAKLDPLAEFQQYSQIQEMMRGRTTILVSHRIGFARLAKRILVMKDGKIIEDGTHDSLLRLNGEYKKMLEEQAKWYDTTWEES